MSKAPKQGGLVVAGLIALVMHGALFVLAKPRDVAEVAGVRVPPNTSYLAGAAQQLPMSSEEVRMTRSPVLFSLPSSMGFSGELMSRRVKAPRIRLNQREPERFLGVEVGSRERDWVDASGLMVSAIDPAEPSVPNGVFEDSAKRPAARRVTLSPELRTRLEGGVVLPAELNQEVEKPWEAIATVSVSELGVVRHVLLEQPIEPVELNQRVLGLIHSLRFKPGDPVEGSIEIYSPESITAKTGEATP